MELVRVICAVLLALPLLVFGANYFLHFFELPPGDGSPGDRLLQSMREGGLMAFIAFSHVVAAILLLVPRTRFLGAMLQLPMSIGILSFHLSMLRAGVGMGLLILALNLVALADLPHLRSLF